MVGTEQTEGGKGGLTNERPHLTYRFAGKDQAGSCSNCVSPGWRQQELPNQRPNRWSKWGQGEVMCRPAHGFATGLQRAFHTEPRRPWNNGGMPRDPQRHPVHERVTGVVLKTALRASDTGITGGRDQGCVPGRSEIGPSGVNRRGRQNTDRMVSSAMREGASEPVSQWARHTPGPEGPVSAERGV